MKLSDVSIPDIYLSSSDFKFFRDWFITALTKIHYDTEHFMDLYDPLKCPKELLWLLADTMGFRYDDRLVPAFNRLVLLYFMSMIRNRGSRDGVTLAAEINLTQFNIERAGQADDINYDRLHDSSIPTNSVYVNPNVEDGYIDIVYFSEELPTDACIEYVRPVGMFCFEHAGVRCDGRTRVSIDARLTDSNYIGISLGPTHVGHYSRADYASLQKQRPNSIQADQSHRRRAVYYRNSVYETAHPSEDNYNRRQINPGLRALYSLQLCNNENIVQALLPSIFGLGKDPQVYTVYPDGYELPDIEPNVPSYNLRYDLAQETSITDDVWTVDSGTQLNPVPKVNPPMFEIGESIPLDNTNTHYTRIDDNGNITDQ